MRKLLLVRHADSARNPAAPAREWPLSPAGHAAAERLADLLAPYAPAAIIASDEQKARQTAQPLAGRLGLAVEVAPGLREHERRTVSYLGADAFQATMARFFAEPDKLVFGEETAHQALARFSKTVEDILARRPSGNIVLFTHGTVLSLFAAAHGAGDPMAFWYHLNLPAWLVYTLPDVTLIEAQMRLPEP